jgi:hypothetical protein
MPSAFGPPASASRGLGATSRCGSNAARDDNVESGATCAPLQYLLRNGSRLVGVLAAEAIDAALRVHQLLFARVEGVTVRANVDREIAAGGAGHEDVATGASDAGARVDRMNTFLHDQSLLDESTRKNWDARFNLSFPAAQARLAVSSWKIDGFGANGAQGGALGDQPCGRAERTDLAAAVVGS